MRTIKYVIASFAVAGAIGAGGACQQQAAAQTPSSRAGDTLVSRAGDSLAPHLPVDPARVKDTTALMIARSALALWRPHFSGGFSTPDLLGLQDRYSMVRYNRAEGLFVGIGGDLPVADYLLNRMHGYFGFGYAFSAHYWQVFGGLGRDFLTKEQPLRVSAEGHIITDTKDAWKMDVNENTLYALLAGVDVRDYYQRNGFSVSLQQFVSPHLVASAGYRYDNYISMQREAGWSLFGPKQPFLPNPPVRQGVMHTVYANILVDYMTNRNWDVPHIGMQFGAEFGLGGANRFGQYVLDIRLKHAFFDGVVAVAGRARLGSVTGDAPAQKLFTIGGYGALEGFPQNAYGGNRLALFQTDLIFHPISKLPVCVIFQNDFGRVAISDTSAPVTDALLGKLASYKYSTGVYIGSPTGLFRLGVAWRTDVYAVPKFVLRFAERF